MRLINVETHELKEFFSKKAPPYAILSHTWGPEEVTFQDWARLKDESTKDQSAKGRSIKDKAGFQKIQGACHQAKKDNLEWLWCDTNCIDKTSSAELTEAINSMFAWYRNSQVCYAYLADIDIQVFQTSSVSTDRESSLRSQRTAEPNNLIAHPGSKGHSAFSKSRWFTRGWTLQELLAPSKEVFFAADWTVLGDKNKLSNWIADITGIHIGALRDRSTIQRYSIAQRMSWAATRETTRIEDIAYCLLGIFNIHIPMLYGEGEAAFQRLQHEIMKDSDDHSIFAWDLQDSVRDVCTGALARSPKAFLSCGSVVRNDDIWRFPFSVTNLGISMEFPLIQGWYDGIDLVDLNCARELRGCDDPLDVLPNRRTSCRRAKVWIFLRRVQHNIYQRVHLPASTVLLQPSYINSVQHTKTVLFIEIQKSHEDRSLPLPESMNPTIQKSIHTSLLSSGIMITFGWGTKNRFNRYEQAFSPSEFSSQVLRDRSPMGISHHLVSNQNFSLLFSVAWNLDLQPQHWAHSTFVDPESKFSRSIVGVDKWKSLVVEGTCTFAHESGNLNDQMSCIHEQLRKDFGEAFRQSRRLSTTPIVLVSPQDLQNLHGQREVLIEIIFRESPKSGLQLD